MAYIGQAAPSGSRILRAAAATGRVGAAGWPSGHSVGSRAEAGGWDSSRNRERRGQRGRLGRGWTVERLLDGVHGGVDVERLPRLAGEGQDERHDPTDQAPAQQDVDQGDGSRVRLVARRRDRPRQGVRQREDRDDPGDHDVGRGGPVGLRDDLGVDRRVGPVRRWVAHLISCGRPTRQDSRAQSTGYPAITSRGERSWPGSGGGVLGSRRLTMRATRASTA